MIEQLKELNANLSTKNVHAKIQPKPNLAAWLIDQMASINNDLHEITKAVRELARVVSQK